MAGGSKGAARTIAQFLEAKLPDAVAATAKGAGRAPATKTRVVRPKSLGNMTAPELREFMLTPRGQRSLLDEGVSPATHEKNSERLGKQNRLWQAQYEQMVFGEVRNKEAAKGFDAKRDSLPASAKEEGTDRVGGNSLYERTENAQKALADKTEFEAKKGQSEDLRSTRKSLVDVTTGRRNAEAPLGESTNRRDRRNPGTEEAEPEDIGAPLERGATAWRSRSEPAGSEVVAGGGDGSTALPVKEKAAPAPQTKREVVDRDPEEIDPNENEPSKRVVRDVQLTDGSTVTPGRPEGRARAKRDVTSVRGTLPEKYLTRQFQDVAKQIRKSDYRAPYDFEYTVNGEPRSVKKGDRVDLSGVRFLLNDDPKLFKNFVGTGLYKNPADRVGGGPGGRLKKGFEPDSRTATKGQMSDAEAKRDLTIGAAGTDPNGAVAGKRLAVEGDDVNQSAVGQANISRMEGRPTQPASARWADARSNLIKTYGGTEATRILQSIANAGDDRVAYSRAYAIAEALQDSNNPGEVISEAAKIDATHGIASALMVGTNRKMPTWMPPSVSATEEAGIAANTARGSLRGDAPAKGGPDSTWSEAENRWVQSPRPLQQHLANRALDRADGRLALQDTPGTPKAGAPGKDDGLVLSEPKDVTSKPQREFRGTEGGKTVEQLLTADESTLTSAELASRREIEAARGEWERFKKQGSSGDGGLDGADTKAERNPSLRRVGDPLKPSTTADRGLKNLTPTWELGSEDALPIQGLGSRPKGGKKAAPPTPVEPKGGDGLAEVSETELAAGMPSRQRKAASGEGDEASRRAAVRAGWSAEERAARKVDPNVAASELSDDLSDFSTGQPTDAELQAIEAERAETASTRARRPVASDTVVNEGGAGSAPPPTAPPTSTVAATAPRTTANRPSQPPPQVVDVSAAAARRRAQAAANSQRPIEKWQADAIDAPNAGSVTRVNEGSPEARPDMHDLRVHGDPTAAIRAAQQRRRAGARGHDTGWGTTFNAPPFREGPLPKPSGDALPDAPQGDIDPSDFADADNPFYVPIDDTPGSGLDGAAAPGVRPQNPWATTAGMRAEYRGKPPGYREPQNPWASTAGMRAEYHGKTPQQLGPPPTRIQQALDSVRQAGRAVYDSRLARNVGIGVGGGGGALVGWHHASNALFPPAPPVGVPDFGDDPAEPMPVSAPMRGDEAALLQSIREMRLREMRRPAGGASRIGYPGTMYQD